MTNGCTALVSVIVPVWNGGSFLAQALASIDAQTVSDWEALLVDDGSTDGSWEVLARWAAGRPDRARVLAHPGQQNRGTAASRNLGLSAAQSPYIAFLDQDDRWAAGKLARQISWLEAHPDALAVSCVPRIDWCSGAPDPVLVAWRTSVEAIASRAQAVPPEAFLTGCPFPMSGAVMRRAAWNIAGPFDPGFPRTSDWLFWACLAHGGPGYLGLLAESLLQYRVHGGNDLKGLSAYPITMLQEAFAISNALALWLSARTGEDAAAIRSSLAAATDFSRAAKDAGIGAADWQKMLLEDAL